MKCECNNRGVSICSSGSRYRDKKKIRNVVRRTRIERQKIILMNDVYIRKSFEGKVIELVDMGVPNLWGRFKDGV